MSDVFFRQSLFRNYGRKPGDVMVMSKPLVARHEVLTANNQVNYAAMAYDLSAGPFVVDIPTSSSDYAIIGEICDNWQAPVVGVGVIGPDAGKGGKYLLAPPGNQDKTPEGYIVVPMEGFGGTMVFRPVVIGEGTMEGSVALAHIRPGHICSPTQQIQRRRTSWTAGVRLGIRCPSTTSVGSSI
jgi:hypothetical protein